MDKMNSTTAEKCDQSAFNDGATNTGTPLPEAVALATDQFRELEYLRLLISLASDIDAIKEHCQVQRKSLSSLIKLVFDYLESKMTVTQCFLQTHDESLSYATFSRGLPSSIPDAILSELVALQRPKTAYIDGQQWFATPLVMDETIIGSFGLTIPEAWPWNEEQTFAVLNIVIEELDDYIYTIQESRIKHLTIVEIQRCLKFPTLTDAIERSVAIMADFVPFSHLVVFYVDDDLSGKRLINYQIFDQTQKLYDNWTTPLPTLDQALQQYGEKLLADKDLLDQAIPFCELTDSFAIDGLFQDTMIGRLLIRPLEDVSLSISSREMLQVFVESLRQRLVDFNREKNVLRQFFSAEVTQQLLQHPDYFAKYLTPRQENIGILYADICGFTKMSEQVLCDPGLIASFVDGWAKEILEGLRPFEVALDKIVGDCLIFFVGPPFYNWTQEKIIQRMLESAVLVRDLTNAFLRRPENEILRNSPHIADFGIAIGINYCQATVGLIRPNHGFTAFSSGMNNTARLQGVARSGEILVTAPVQEIATRMHGQRWHFDGPMTVALKNVQDPLPYYCLSHSGPSDSSGFSDSSDPSCSSGSK